MATTKISDNGLNIIGENNNGVISFTGGLSASAISGTFSGGEAVVVTVVNGIITAIA